MCCMHFPMVDCCDLHMFQFVCLLLFGQVQKFCSTFLSCVPAEVDVTDLCCVQLYFVSCNLLVTESSKSSVSVFRSHKPWCCAAIPCEGPLG